MKYCPACRSQYSDVTLRFCLQDGAILHVSEAKQSTIDTISFSDPITADNILRTEEMNLFLPAEDTVKAPPTQTDLPKLAPPQYSAEIEKTGTSRLVWFAVFPLVLLVAAAGFGGWFFLNNQNKSSVKSASPIDSTTPELAAKTPPANTSDSTSKVILDDLSQSPNSNSDPSSTSGSEDIKKEIADAVELWRQALEARKVPEYLSKYAEKADYFDKDGAGIAEIRAEAQKMFEAYSDIDITLTNVRVAVDPEGTQATAIFDKEWSYETAKDLLEGKARTKLRFQKSGKDWKIISEKYQKVYYMEN